MDKEQTEVKKALITLAKYGLLPKRKKTRGEIETWLKCLIDFWDSRPDKKQTSEQFIRKNYYDAWDWLYNDKMSENFKEAKE